MEAARGAPAGEALHLRSRASEQLLRSGHIDEGLAATRDVLAAIDMKLARSPESALASLLLRRAQLRVRGLKFTPKREREIPSAQLHRIDVCWSVAVGLSLVDVIRGADYHTRALLLALDAGEPGRLSRALAMAACFASSEGGRARARAGRLLEQAEMLAREVGQPYALGWLPLARGMIAVHTGRWREALEQCEKARAVFRERCPGAAWELDSAQAFQIWSLGYLGDLNELRRRVTHGLRDARGRGDRYAEMNMRTGASHYVRLADDDPEGSRKESREALASWSQAGFHLQHMFDLFVQCETDLYAGEPRQAYARAMREWPAMRRSMLLRVQNARLFMEDLRGRCAVAAGQIEDAERIAARIEAEGMPWSDPMASALRAGIARTRGEDPIRHLRRALAGFEVSEMALHAAAMRRALGEALGGDEGRAQIEAADAWMHAQGVKNPARMRRTFAW
jgi:hypothetical protein